MRQKYMALPSKFYKETNIPIPISTDDLRKSMGEILDCVNMRGNEFIIERKHHPLAVLIPVQKHKALTEITRKFILDKMMLENTRNHQEKTSIEYKLDKASWPRGEWDYEPDYSEWTDEETGYLCYARRNKVGAWCGYVNIRSGHPLFDKPHLETWDLRFFEVYGGITFYAKDSEGQWWVGFDCAHNDDFIPMCPFNKPSSYKNLEYVKEECKKLALQLMRYDTSSS
jgi:antitoxin (DNA-binding transcriptional repressor) of toxin-antitoxin stability system